MIDLPFTINFNPLPEPDKLVVNVDLERAVQKSKHNLNILFSPLEVFADLGNVGGLAGNQHPPDSSSLKLIGVQQVSDQRLEWSLSYHNIDHRSINVLMNMLHFLHFKLASIQKAMIAAPQDILISQQINELPPLFRPLSFTFIDEREGDESDLNIEIHFPNEQPESLLTEVEDAFGHWFSAANNGAFLSSTYSPDLCKIYLGDVPVNAGSILTMYIEKIVMDEEDAINSLLNVFQWVHVHVISINEIRFSV